MVQKNNHRTSDFVIVTGCPTLARMGVSRTDSTLKIKEKYLYSLFIKDYLLIRTTFKKIITQFCS